MKVICKQATPETCPVAHNICCGTCDMVKNCGLVCPEATIWQTCADAETITDEMVQFETAAPEAIREITRLVVLKKELEEQEKLLKEQLVKAMEAYGVKSFDNGQIKLTYLAPTTRSTLDSTRLKKDHPDIVEEYTKVSNVSASVRITVK